MDPLNLTVHAFNLVVFLSRVVRQRVLLYQSHSWPVVAGTVEMAQVAPAHYSYGATITYSYAVNGSFYSGEQTWYHAQERTAERRLAELPSGAAVMIRYNPDDHSRSVVDQGSLTFQRDGIPLT